MISFPENIAIFAMFDNEKCVYSNFFIFRNFHRIPILYQINKTKQKCESIDKLVRILIKLSRVNSSFFVVLTGALTPVITNLLGVSSCERWEVIEPNMIMQLPSVITLNFHLCSQPNGIDIPSTIGSGTALLAGLLAGDQNFGKVVGDYAGERRKVTFK